MNKIIFSIPLRIVSELNSNEHWTQKHKRHKTQQCFIRAAFGRTSQRPKLPCTVKLIRLAPRQFDSDNLQGAFKYIRDEVSEILLPEKTGSYINKIGKVVKLKGRADSDERIRWEYSQEKCNRYGIRIEVEDFSHEKE